MTETNPSKPYFEAVADQWDGIRASYFSDAVRDVVIRKAYLHPDMIVADIGAGTGYMSAGLTDKVAEVHVVDGSAAMLATAQKNLAKFNNITYHEADGMQLPFDDASLDAVVANMYLHHCPQPLAAIREMARVLRPGGRLLISDMDAHPHEWMRTEMSDIWLGFDRAQLHAWLTEAGLVNVLVGDTQQTCQSSSQTAGSEQTVVSIFYAAGTQRVSGMRDLVKEQYGAIAEKNSCCGGSSDADGGSACCSQPVISLEGLKEGEVHFDQDYSPEEQSQVPPEAAAFSLGCGNPIAMANMKPGEVVVDIGSGGGLDSFLAAKRVGPSGHVIGVDMTPAMLKRSRRSAKLNGYTNVEFRRGDAADLPVEADSVDVIISNCVINLTEDKGKVFAEAYRVLKPGGRLEISDMVFSGPVGKEARAAAVGWSDCVTGALIEDEMLDLVAQAGFKAGAVRRSASHGEVSGAKIYSVILSAVKE